MANNLAIAVTAETGEARAQLALLQQDLRQLGQAMRRTASEARSSDIDGGAGEKLVALASQFEAVRGEISKTKDELKETAESGFGRLNEAVKEPLEGLAMLGSSLRETAELAGIMFVVDKAREYVSSMTELGERTVNMAAAVGTAPHQFSALSGAMKLATGDALESGRTLERLGKNIQEALTQPAGNAAKAAASLGISQQELRRAATDLGFAIDLLADKFAKFRDSPLKSADFLALTGRGMDELVPILKRGASGFEELKKDAEAAGIVLTDKDAEALDQTAEKLHKMAAIMEGESIRAFLSMNSTIDSGIDRMNSFARSISDVLSEYDHLLDSLQTKIGPPSDWFDWLPSGGGGRRNPRTGERPGGPVGDTGTVRREGSPFGAAAPPAAASESDTDASGTSEKKPLPAAWPEKPAGAKGGATEIETWRSQLEAAIEKRAQDERNYFADSTAMELAFWQSKVALTAAGSKEQAQVLHTIFELQKRQAQQSERDQEAALSGQQRASDALYQLKLQKVQDAAALNATTAAQERQQEESLLDDKFALDQQYFAAKLQAAQGDVKERLKLLNEEKLASIKFIADQSRLIQQASLKWQQELQSVLSPIKTSVVSGLEGVLNRSKTPGQAAAGVGTAALDTVFSKLGDVLFNRLGQLITSVLPEAFKTALGIGQTTAEITAITATGPAATVSLLTPVLTAQTAALLAPLTTIAIATGAKAVPVVGPALEHGGIIPSAAGGWTVPAFASGGILSVLHQREMVLPRHISEFVQDAAANYRGEGAAMRPSSSAEPRDFAVPAVSGDGNGGGGGSPFHLHVHAPDGPAAHRFLVNNMHSVAKAFHKATRNGSLGRK